MATDKYRIEHDLLGNRQVPADVYYGVHTLRAVENFPITGTPISIYPDLIRALACIKQAAALANQELGLLGKEKTEVIVKACEELRAGKLHEQFVVDVIQGGAGTSTNMNANEVIANRALEHLGHQRGEYKYLHPNEDVNMSQSTNDVYPTSLKVAGWFGVFGLVDAMAVLRRAFEVKAEEFKDVLKMGRTQLQDAVPMTLGQEFSTYAVMLGEDEERLKEAALLYRGINLGAPAIGTDVTVSFAAEAGQLQLNAFEPIIAHSLFKSVTHLSKGCLTLAERCVSGITANRERLRASVENSIGVVTALNPYIGYANATEVAQQALMTGKSVYDLVLKRSSCRRKGSTRSSNPMS